MIYPVDSVTHPLNNPGLMACILLGTAVGSIVNIFMLFLLFYNVIFYIPMLISIFYSNLYLYILCPLISIGFSPKRGVSFRHLIKCLSIYLGKL